MAVWDVAMAPIRAVGGAFNELDKAMQGRDAGQEKRQRQLLQELQVVQETTPENTRARIEAMREVLTRHGMSMPPMLNQEGENQYEEIPTSYERAQTKSAEARTQATGTMDPVQKAKAVSELIGNRPWSGDEGDTYDAKNPEHRIWMQSLEELGGGADDEPAEPTPTGADGSEGNGFFRTVRDTLTGAARRPGSALDSIPAPGAETETPDQWRIRVRGDRSQETANQAPRQTPREIPAAGVLGSTGQPARQMPPAGSALAGIPSPSPGEIDAALGQVENAGAVTVRNARKVQQSQAAPASTLMAAARAVKAYKASPEYVEMTRTTGRLLNETDLSGQIKSVLAEQSASDQKRLLQMIHKHGEAKILAAVAQGSQGHGQ